MKETQKAFLEAMPTRAVNLPSRLLFFSEVINSFVLFNHDGTSCGMKKMLTTPDQKSSTAASSLGGGPGSACSHVEVVTPIIAMNNCSSSSSSSNRTKADDTTADNCTAAAALSTTTGSSSIINDTITQQQQTSIYQVHDINETIKRKSSSGMNIPKNEEQQQHNSINITPSVLRGESGEEKCDDGITNLSISAPLTTNNQGRPKRTASTASPQKNKTIEKIMTPILLSPKHRRTVANDNNNNNNNQLTKNYTMTAETATLRNDNTTSSLTEEETSSSLFHLLLESGGRGVGPSSSPSSPSSRQYLLWVSWNFISVEQKTGDYGDGRSGRVQVGDLMCMMDSTIDSSSSLVQHHSTPLLSSTTNSNESSLSYRHQPFNVPWRPCQILSIFRERILNKLSSKKKQYGPLLVEIRWFYRQSDIDDTASNRASNSTTTGIQGYKNKTTKKKRMRDDVHQNNNNDGGDDNDNSDDDEVFETSHVVVLPASFLLGRLDLRTRTERKACKYDDNVDSCMQQTLAPAVMVSCCKFYFHQGHEIVNIRLDDIGGEKNTVVLRGLECSEVLQNDHILKEATYTSLNYTTPTTHDNVAMKVDLPSPILSTISAVYYASCSLAHPLTQLIHGNLLYPMMTPTSLPRWELCVGDIVAIHCDESTLPDYSKSWYPYIVPWSHCQVMSIYIEGDDNADDDDDMSRFSGGGASVSSKKQTPKKKKTKRPSTTSAGSTMMSSSSVDAALVKVEVRWFPRVSEAILESKGRERELKSLTELSNDDKTPVEIILEGRQISIIDCISLLGPVSIVDIDGWTKVHTTPAPAYLPQNRRIICTSMTCDESGKPRFSSRLSNITDPVKRVECGINHSLRYDKSHMKTVIDAVKRVRNERLHRTTTDSHHVTLDIERQPSTGLDDNSHGKRDIVEQDSARSGKRSKSATNDSSVVVNTPLERTKAHARSDRAVRNDREKYEILSIIQPIHETSRISCNTDPYHVDVSALKSFYKDIDIIPPVDSYDTRSTSVGGDIEKHVNWKVKLGDTVAVEIEQDTKVHSSTHYPFTVQWAPGEVVTIYRLHKTKASCALLREGDSKQNDEKVKSAVLQESLDSEIMIEIRWLYRIWEIPGASKKKAQSVDQLEEVFETDQLVVCSADSILSPVHLYDAATSTIASKIPMGIPNINYHCSRFWSIHRRSFVPSGSLSNRVSRGRMHSAYKAAFSKLASGSSAEIVDPSSSTSWEEEFQTAIQKLSLAESAHDAQENGMVLSCRENERAQIISFVRKAISGLAQSCKFDGGVDEEVKNLKSSLFIAGPPGTGKVRW